MQALNGSPVKPWRQLHIGLWFTTVHSAFKPQEPKQGFVHLWFTHAAAEGQSEDTTHSGRHNGGLPVKLSIHLHTEIPLTAWQWLFGPQGEGEHGVVTEVANEKKIFINFIKSYLKISSWFSQITGDKFFFEILNTWTWGTKNESISLSSGRTRTYW